jgi:hypothetical protein
MRPLAVGDVVRVLRASRLPIEEPLGVGEIERVTHAEGGRLYWVSGFACARSERELRRTQTRWCPHCKSGNLERIAGLWLCQQCGHEWDAA